MMNRAAMKLRVLSVSLILWSGSFRYTVTGFVHYNHNVAFGGTTRVARPLQLFAAASWPDGLMDQNAFEASCRLDETLTNLQRQLPNTLKVPLTLSNALLVYDPELFQLVGPNDEVLVSSVDELVSLSSTLVATTWSAQTAQRALMSTFATTDESSSSSSSPIVECELVWDTTNQDKKLTVTWSTTTVVGRQLVEGISEMILNNGKITKHKLLDVSLDGRTISAIGEAMATLRSAVRSVPFPQNSPLLDTIFEVRDGFLAAAAQSADDASSSSTEDVMSPLFYNTCINATETVLIDSSNSTAVSEMEYYPLPGSSVWQDYASSHKALFSFWSHDVPRLAGEEFVINDDTINFASNATLWGPNSKKSTLLLEGGAKIAQAYQTLASLRRASSGKWKIQSAHVDWRERTCDIQWLATIPTGIATIEGTDRFTLNGEGSVESIQQMELSVGGNMLLDPEPVRGFLTTLEAYDGVLVATPGAEIMSDLSRRLSNIMAGSSSPRSVSPDNKSPMLPPKLGTDAAASVYNLMCALHEDLSHIQDLVVAPASTFVDEDISLRGYMGEVLAKGSPAYRQSIGLALASLRGAIRTNSVSVDTDPKVTIEFTQRGNLRVSLTLLLMVNPLLGTATAIGGRTPVSSGFPLKMEALSEYRLKSGKIKKHALLETRINGQLTPADVVSRWIKRILSPSPEENNNMNGGGSMSALLDIVAWARSMGGGAARK